MMIKTKKKRSSLSYQAIGVIVVGVVCLLLVGTLIAVNYLTKITPFEIDGTTYYVHKETHEDGSVSYKLTDKDKNPLTMTEDGYFTAFIPTKWSFVFDTIMDYSNVNYGSLTIKY